MYSTPGVVGTVNDGAVGAPLAQLDCVTDGATAETLTGAAQFVGAAANTTENGEAPGLVNVKPGAATAVTNTVAPGVPVPPEDGEYTTPGVEGTVNDGVVAASCEHTD
ncbi:MAG: hypothetical protein NVSMB55_25140 [Mycobacteriales bacterium]